MQNELLILLTQFLRSWPDYEVYGRWLVYDVISSTFDVIILNQLTDENRIFTSDENIFFPNQSRCLNITQKLEKYIKTNGKHIVLSFNSINNLNFHKCSQTVLMNFIANWYDLLLIVCKRGTKRGGLRMGLNRTVS